MVVTLEFASNDRHVFLEVAKSSSDHGRIRTETGFAW